MNKAELVAAIAERSGEHPKAVKEILSAFESVITSTVAGGGKVQLPGFLSFEKAEQAARAGRNPATGAIGRSPAIATPMVTVGRRFQLAGVDKGSARSVRALTIDEPSRGMWDRESDQVDLAIERTVSDLEVHVVDLLGDYLGLTSDDASNVLLELRDRIADRARWVGDVRDTLRSELTPTLAELDPVPRATLMQAKRLANLRTDLLASGAWTLSSLAEARGTSIEAARQFVHRARTESRLFTVTHDGQALVPAFLLQAEDLAPRAELAESLATLMQTRMGPWELWTWFTRPTPWLVGDVPERLATSSPERVAEAARRRASNLQ